MQCPVQSYDSPLLIKTGSRQVSMSWRSANSPFKSLESAVLFAHLWYILQAIGKMSEHAPMKKMFYSTPDHPFEKRYGYYRAVRKGPFVAVAGTTPYDPRTQKLLYPGDAGKQAAAILVEIIGAIKAVGSKGAEDVIRVRVFLAVSSPESIFPSLLTSLYRTRRI